MEYYGGPYNIPDRCPLYPPLPYRYRGYRKLSAFCRADPAGIGRALPKGFEAAADVIEVFVMACPDAGPLGSYQEGGIVVPVRYRGLAGAHVLYEYVTNDDSLSAGREIWGYPKKIAERVRLDETGPGIRGEVARRGVGLIEVEFTPGDAAFEKPQMQPRLQVKRFPRADGEGFDVDQVVVNELHEAAIRESRRGRARVTLGGSGVDPVSELGVGEVIGAEFVVGDFLLDYGRVLEDRVRRV